MKQTIIVLLTFVATAGGGFAVLYLALWLIERKNRGKRSPLCRELLRSPGEALRQQLDNLSSDIYGEVAITYFGPIMLCAFVMAQINFAPQGNSKFLIVLTGFVALCFLLYQCRKLYTLLALRSNLRLGYDAEMAVGQELNQLMLHGYRVYHDFPADDFNIDHIVFGPNGVFAVETKGRAKPEHTNKDKQNWTVFFDGQNLKFPKWTDNSILPQARRQAKWLTNWLSSAVGEPVQVRPILALPGWNVELLKPCDVPIINGKNPHKLWSKLGTENLLSEPMINRIAHQLEQSCRNVEPLAYKNTKKAKQAN